MSDYNVRAAILTSAATKARALLLLLSGFEYSSSCQMVLQKRIAFVHCLRNPSPLDLNLYLTMESVTNTILILTKCGYRYPAGLWIDHACLKCLISNGLHVVEKYDT